jgi:putative ABC transport system permease protein
MFIFKNALRNIVRTKGRTALISIIVIAVAVASSIAMAINNAALWAKQNELENKTITASITINREKMMEKAMENAKSSGQGNRTLVNPQNSGITELTLDTLENYAKLPAVLDFYYTDSIGVSANSESFQKLQSQSTTQPQNQPGPQMRGGGGNSAPNRTPSDFTLVGYSSTAAMNGFVNFTEKVTEGTVFNFDTPNYDCLITKELAAYNKLGVGDTFTVGNPNDQAQNYALKVGGIYEQTEQASTSGNIRAEDMMSSANNILVNYRTVADIQARSKQASATSAFNARVSNTFVFSSKSNYDAFTNQVRAMGLSDDYAISSADIQNFENELVPLENLSKFAKVFLLVILILGGIILVVINIFNIRERKYEIGVLTAIGISKPKVILQFVSELLAITLLSVVIGTGIGATTSVPVANALLSNQVEAQKAKAESAQQNFGRAGHGTPGRMNAANMPPGSHDAKFLDNVNATVNIAVLLQLIGVGVLLVAVASVASALFVVRYEPLQILADRN